MGWGMGYSRNGVGTPGVVQGVLWGPGVLGYGSWGLYMHQDR